MEMKIRELAKKLEREREREREREKKLSRDVPAPRILNPKMKIPSHLPSLHECWTGLKWESELYMYCLVLYTGFFDDLTGVSRKLRARFAEAAPFELVHAR